VLTQRDGSRSATPGRAARSWRVRRPWVIGYTAGVVVLAAATALVVALAGGQHRPPPPRAAARAFSLAELGHPGSTITLASYAGRPLIINFFASWCAPCQRETPMLARYYESQHGRVIVLGIDSNDETAAAVRFVRKTGVHYPVAFDPYPSATTTSYGVYALPQTFFLNSKHRIVSHILGPLTMKDLIAGTALMDKDRG